VIPIGPNDDTVSKTRGGLLLTRTRDSQMDRAKRTVRDVAKYAEEIAKDERLRADVSAALAHGSKVGDRLKEDIGAGGAYTRLAGDKKLRKNLRALLDDLDAASDRVRRKKSHRIRNVALMLVGALATTLALPKIRQRLTELASDNFGTSNTEPDPLT
jgi:hypothetical protein